MIVPADKRVVPRAAMGGFRTGNEYQTASPGGPAGSSLMTWFVSFAVQRTPSTQILFARSSALTTGWFAYLSGTTIRFGVANSTPATVEAGTFSVAGMIGQLITAIGTYNNGVMSVWVDGVAAGTTTLGAGYTSQAVATAIGVRSAGALPAVDSLICDCGMLDNFNAGATFAAIDAQWKEDQQQGRYLTWPRTGASNSDWYWSARDAIAGPNGKASWVDRFSAVTASRTGVPQAAQVMPRF